MNLPPATRLNTALRYILERKRGRLTGPAAAPLQIQSGVWRFSWSLKTRADAKQIAFRIYDSVSGDYAEIRIRPKVTPEVEQDEEADITATLVETVLTNDNQVTNFSFTVSLPDDSGEWILSVSPEEGADLLVESLSIERGGLPGSTPQGVVTWGGDYNPAETYSAGALVRDGLTLYVLRDNAGGNEEPSTSAHWDIALTLVGFPAAIQIPMSGITANAEYVARIPGDIRLVGWAFDSNTPGSIVLDLRANSTYPVSGNSIVASAPITVTSAQNSSSNVLTGWTTDLDQNDILVIVPTSVSGITSGSLTLYATRR